MGVYLKACILLNAKSVFWRFRVKGLKVVCIGKRTSSEIIVQRKKGGMLNFIFICFVKLKLHVESSPEICSIMKRHFTITRACIRTYVHKLMAIQRNR